MRCLILSDIFGQTPELLQLAESLNLATSPVIEGPYEEISTTFLDESDAYKHFVEIGGIASYVEKLRKLDWDDISVVIGFSAGGSAVWKMLSANLPSELKQVICFYPSQIRHSIHLSPPINTRIVLPKTEPHFCINTLSKQLMRKEKVVVDHSDYLHGFMNKLSINYCEQGYKHYHAMLATYLPSLLD